MMVGHYYTVIETEYRLMTCGIERTKKLESILRDLEAPIMRLDSNMARLCQQVEGILTPLYGDPGEFLANPSLVEEKRGKILQWLSTIEYVKHHENNQEGLLADTGNWLLTGEKFDNWLRATASSFLWLRGDRKFTRNRLISIYVLT